MFLFSLLNNLAGYVELECPAALTREAVNRLAANELDYWALRRRVDGALTFSMLEKEYARLMATDGPPIAYRIVRRKGLPQFLRRYRKRIGLPIGFLLLLILTKLSTQFVWDITVSGNEVLSDTAIVESLEELGCSVGSYIPSVDFYRICHAFLLENEEIAWISVNMVGTTAQVEVIETAAKDGAEENGNGTPSNLLARFGGEIVRTETASGKVAVAPGQTVEAGQLLVSGVVDVGREEEGRFVLVPSRGKVYARTERSLTVEVPFLQTKKVLAEERTYEKIIKFFGKNIKIKENSSILPDGCDIIEENRRIVLLEELAGGVSLPIFVKTKSIRCYQDVTVSLTADEAKTVAVLEMTALFEAEFKEAEILARTETVETSSEGLRLVWQIVSIENIAEESPIGLS